jgi:hypothetical protein
MICELDRQLAHQVIEALAAQGIESNQDFDGIVQTACGAWRS